ncbi:MAG: hypothetical protein ACREQY_22395 [Candidatus Binatia bacterium]
MSQTRISIKPSDVGKRVTVQFFTDEGERREAVGVLEHVAVVEGEIVFHIRRRDESLVKVPLRRVRLGKVV